MDNNKLWPEKSYQDLITTAKMTNHAPTTNLVLLFLPCPPISLNFKCEGSISGLLAWPLVVGLVESEMCTVVVG
jgi:hypothetical protein